MTYSLTPEAEAELENAVAFCTAHFSRNVAESFLTTLELKIRLIAEFPGVGTPTNKGRRLFPIGRYPLPSRRWCDSHQRHRPSQQKTGLLAEPAVATGVGGSIASDAERSGFRKRQLQPEMPRIWEEVPICVEQRQPI